MKMGKLIGFIAILISIFFLWTVYSFFRFDGFFLPQYVFGLSHPYEYYQEYIGSKLEQYGQEYKVLETDTAQWDTYRDPIHNFEFKYPHGLVVEDFVQDKYHKNIRFLNGDNQKDLICEVEIESEGWKLGRYGLPSERHRTDYNILKNRKNEFWYIYDQYKGVISVSSTRFDTESDSDIKFTGATFIEKTNGRFLHLVDNGNTCEESQMKGILATFRFID